MIYFPSYAITSGLAPFSMPLAKEIKTRNSESPFSPESMQGISTASDMITSHIEGLMQYADPHIAARSAHILSLLFTAQRFNVEWTDDMSNAHEFIEHYSIHPPDANRQPTYLRMLGHLTPYINPDVIDAALETYKPESTHYISDQYLSVLLRDNTPKTTTRLIELLRSFKGELATRHCLIETLGLKKDDAAVTALTEEFATIRETLLNQHDTNFNIDGKKSLQTLEVIVNALALSPNENATNALGVELSNAVGDINQFSRFKRLEYRSHIYNLTSAILQKDPLQATTLINVLRNHKEVDIMIPMVKALLPGLENITNYLDSFRIDASLRDNAPYGMESRFHKVYVALLNRLHKIEMTGDYEAVQTFITTSRTVESPTTDSDELIYILQRLIQETDALSDSQIYSPDEHTIQPQIQRILQRLHLPDLPDIDPANGSTNALAFLLNIPNSHEKVSSLALGILNNAAHIRPNMITVLSLENAIFKNPSRRTVLTCALAFIAPFKIPGLLTLYPEDISVHDGIALALERHLYQE